MFRFLRYNHFSISFETFKITKFQQKSKYSQWKMFGGCPQDAPELLVSGFIIDTIYALTKNVAVFQKNCVELHPKIIIGMECHWFLTYNSSMQLILCPLMLEFRRSLFEHEQMLKCINRKQLCVATFFHNMAAL